MAGMRLQTRHWRALTWVATLGVACGAGAMLWTIVKNFRSGHYRSRSSTDFNDIIEKAVGTIKKDQIGVTPKTDYAHLWTSPINGFVKHEDKKVEGPPPEPPKPTKKPIGDALHVKAVLYAPDDGGRVVIEYRDDSVTKDAKTDHLILKVSGKLAHPYDEEPYFGSLKAIKENSAVFSWQGEEVVLHPTTREEMPHDAKPAKDKGGPKTLSGQDEKDLDQHKDAKETIALGNERYLVGSDDRDSMNKNGDKFLEDVTIKSRPGADKKPEVVLGGIRPKSTLATNYGVQNDDVVVSINGNPVVSKNQAIQWARENPNLPRYDVVIRRKGKEITKTFLVPQNK
jgi:hypothetical protein